ncbi:MAG: DUF4390 domain-containing protein [Desulfovibrionaceae bacterium]|nr:DUF4390 domain-containing protein [Desulfovibrionaceae bacterium]MBF0514116.1 DUF4390 domain-containing protein [Desulfovibrionaceae bacterium]
MSPAAPPLSPSADRAGPFNRPGRTGRIGPLALLAALTAATLFFSHAGLARAQDISLSNLIVDNSGGSISVLFGVQFANPQAIEAALSEGAQLDLVCTARLAAKRDYWFDREIGRTESVSHLLKIAPSQYRIVTPDGEGPLTGQDFPALLAAAFEDFSMTLGPGNMLNRGGSYSLSMEIRLERPNISPWLNKSLFFWSFDAAPPARYRLDFTY